MIKIDQASFGAETPISIARHYRLVVVLAITRALLGYALGFRPFDDTFITFRYALNLSTGAGFVFNAGERVLGTTSPLWTLLLAGCHRAGLPISSGALAIALAADAVSVMLIHKIMRALRFSPGAALSAALLFLFCFDSLSIARSGMEEALFVLLALSTILAMIQQRSTLAGLLAGLACLARPEGLLLLPLLVFSIAAESQSLSWRRFSACLAALSVSIGLWLAFAIAYFGTLTPQSIVAKAAHVDLDPGLAAFNWRNVALFFTKGQAGDGIFTRSWLQLNLAVTALSLLALCAMLRTPTRVLRWQRTAYIGYFPIAYIGGLATAGAFTWFPWYYGPIYPFGAMLAGIGASTMCSTARSKGLKENATFLTTLISVLVASQTLTALLIKIPNDHSFLIAGYAQVSESIPRAPSLTVATAEIGVVGWTVWPTRILDMAGLVTPGAQGADRESLLLKWQPDYIVLRTDEYDAAGHRGPREAAAFRNYQLMTAIQDPYQPRRFLAYSRASRDSNP